MGYLFLGISIVFTVMSQILVKWRINTKYVAIAIPEDVFGKIIWLSTHIFFDPILIFSIGLTFLSGVTWMATMTKLEIGVAYPFVSLSYVFVLLLSALLLGESLTFPKVMGVALIVLGIVVSSRT